MYNIGLKALKTAFATGAFKSFSVMSHTPSSPGFHGVPSFRVQHPTLICDRFQRSYHNKETEISALGQPGGRLRPGQYCPRVAHT